MITRLIMLVILIGLGAVLHLPAQGGFNLTYENPLFANNSMRFDHVIISNDTLTVMGTYVDDSLQASNIIVIRIDTAGHVLRFNTIVDTTRSTDYVTAPGSILLRCSDNGYAIPANAFLRNNAMVLKLNANLEVEFVSEFDHNDRLMVANQLIETEKGFLLLGRIQRTNFNIMTFGLMMDHGGNEIWRKYFGHPSYNQSFGPTLKINDNEFVIGSIVAPPHNEITQEADKRSTPWIYAIDSTGLIKWEWFGEEHDGEGWGAWNLKKTGAGGYVYNSHKRHVIDKDNSGYTPVLTMRDSAMNLVWERDYEEGPLSVWSYFADLQILDNDEIVMAGIRGQTFNGIDATVGRVVKASDMGEQRWEITDTGQWSLNGAQSFVTGMAVSQTGSIYTCGRTRVVGSKTQGWLIKVTPDGCIDTLCMTTSLSDLIHGDEQEFNIYPNPSQGRFTIEAGQPSPGDYIFTLYDIYGRLVEQERFDHTATIYAPGGTPPGVYAYVIRDETTGRQPQSGKVVLE